MDVGTRDAVAASAPNRGFLRWASRFLAVPRVRIPLVNEPAPVREVPLPATLTFFLGRSDVRGPLLSPSVHEGDQIALRAPLGKRGSEAVYPAPVAGRVAGIRNRADVRGGKPGFAVLLEPSGNGPGEGLPPLEAAAAPVDELRRRLAELGVTDPVAAADERALVLLAADPEPGLSSTLRLLVDDPAAAVRAARLCGRLAGASEVILAVPAPQRATVAKGAAGAVKVIPLAAEYPCTLPEVVARAMATGGAPPLVVPLPEARAALDAVETGRAPTHRIVTIVGPEGEASNYRIPLGASLADALAAAGLEARPGDLVATGGPYRGLAQYSLDAAVDASVNGIVLVRGGGFAPWVDAPCVNCGACIDVCPENLQAQHLARFSEFGLFDRTLEYGIHDCIECGICATVCPSRRPMLQRIRLAKRELAAAAAAEVAALAEIAAGCDPSTREPDPIAVPVATAKEN